MSPIST